MVNRFLSVTERFKSAIDDRFIISSECFLSVVEGFFTQWMYVFSSVVERFLTGGDLFYPLKDSSEKAFGARNKISCHFIEPFTFIYLHLFGGFGRKTPSVLPFSSLSPSAWCIFGFPSFSRFLIFRMVFLLFRNFFRKFAVPGPLLFWSLAGVSRFRSLYFQSSFPFCPLVFPFPRAVSAVSPCNFSLFPGFFEVIGRTSERAIYIIKVYRKASFQLVLKKICYQI